MALPQGALFWPSRRALLVADLHFEKASWFARGGQMLPPYDSQATLEQLEALTSATGAREIWCLGDSFHDVDGPTRLAAACRERLASLMQAVRWTWVTGNHDPALDGNGAAGLGGDVVAEADVEGIILRHEADPSEDRPEMSGHFHPKMRLSLRGRHVARRCFVRSGTKLLMPAFGALTGGMDAGHQAIRAALRSDAEALVPVENKLLCFPIAVEGRTRRSA